MESRFLLTSRWSNAAHEAAFRSHYQSAGQSMVGCSVLQSRGGGSPSGVFHWRACLGVICLHEECIDNDLVDNSAQFRYGDSHVGLPIAVRVDCNYTSNGEKRCQLRILVKDGSLCLINLSSKSDDSLLAYFVNSRQGHTVDINSDFSSRQSNTYGNIQNWTAFCGAPDKGLSILCGCVGQSFAAVGLSDGNITCYKYSLAQKGLHMIGKRAVTINRSTHNLNIFQKWFSAAPGATALEEGTMGINGRNALLTLQCLQSKNQILSLSRSGTMCVVDVEEGAVLAEMDFLNTLQKQYSVLSGDASIEDAVVTICEDDNASISSTEINFACGFCVRVKGQDNPEHLEWHVVVATITSAQSFVWRVVDYGSVYAPLSRCSLLDLHISKQSTEEYRLDSRWKNDSQSGEDTFLLLNTKFKKIDAGSSIALPCNSKVMMLNNDAREIEKDCTITAAIKTNGGWEAGLNRSISGDQAAIAVKMLRLQRLFIPGRFSLSTIIDTLMHDIPIPFALDEFQTQDLNLALVIKMVCQANEEWAHLKMEGDLDDFNDNQCDNFAEFLDLCLLEFTKLCHRRKMTESNKASRGSLAVLSLPRGATALVSSAFDACSLISDHYGVTVVPVPTDSMNPSSSSNLVVEGEDVDAMLGLSSKSVEKGVLQLISTAVPKRSFVELDILFSKYILEAPDIDTTMLSWVVQQGSYLASMIHDQAAHQLDNLVTDQKTLTALFDSLDSLTLSSSLASCSMSFSGADPIVVGEPSQSPSFKSSLMESMASRQVENEYKKLRKILVLFSYLVSARCKVASNVLSEVQSTYLPKVVHEFVYVGLIRWFSTIRPSDSTDLRRLLDLDDLFPSSLALSKRRPYSRNFIDTSTANQSVFGSFWKSSRLHGTYDGDDGLTAAQICAMALRPSCLSDFSHYLLQDGHFSCLRRLAALLDIRLQSEVNGFVHLGASDDSKSVTFATEVMQSRIRTMMGMASFYEKLRLYALNTRNDVDSSTDDDEAIKQSFSDLIRTFPSVDGEGASMSQDGDGGASEMLIGDSSNSDADVSVKGIRDNLKVAISHLTSSINNLSHVQCDAMACLEDTMLRIVEESPIFREVVRVYVREDRLADLFAHNSSFLRRLFAVNHIKDVLEVAKRARVVLQHNTGSEMSLNGNYMLMNYIKETMELYGDLLDSHPVLNTLMVADYINSWGRIFNAALESNSLDEALSAIVRMVELDDDDNQNEIYGTGMMEEFNEKQLVQPWQACLRSLVTLACESGELEWLCNVPEIKIGLISLTECIIAELSRLSKSRSTVKALSASGKPTEINYGECLFCFQLNRGIYRDAAGALYDYTRRLSESPENVHNASFPADLNYRSKALAACLCIFNQMDEQSQAFLLAQKDSSKMLHCVAPSDVENEFLRLTAAEKIQSPKEHDDFEGLVVGLCESREWESVYLALQMCHHAVLVISSNSGSDPNESSSLPKSMRVPQETLTRCMRSTVDAFTSISVDERIAGRVTSIDEFAPYAHHIEGVDSPLRFLISTLRTLDSKELNWALHRTAAKKLLSERPSIPLPADLQSSFLSRPGATNILLSLLIDSGHLSEACTIASAVVDSATDIMLRRDKAADKVYLPYDLLDRLFISAKGSLASFSPASIKEKEDLQRLKGDAELLENSVLKYFRETTV